MFKALNISLNLCKKNLIVKNLNQKNILTNFKHLKTSVPKNSTVTAASENAAKSKTIGLWLAGCSGMVAGAVVLGGVTRY